jgi:hypothetical protein
MVPDTPIGAKMAPYEIPSELVVEEILKRCSVGIVAYEEPKGVNVTFSKYASVTSLLGLSYFSQAYVDRMSFKMTGQQDASAQDLAGELDFVTTDALLNEIKYRYFPTAIALLWPIKTVEAHNVHITGTGTKIQSIGLMAYAALKIHGHIWNADGVTIDKAKALLSFDNLLEMSPHDCKIAAYLDKFPRVMIEGPPLDCVGLADVVRHLAFIDTGGEMKDHGETESPGEEQ